MVSGLLVAALQASVAPVTIGIDCAVSGSDGSREQVLILLGSQRRHPGEGYGATVRVTRDGREPVAFPARTDIDPLENVPEVYRLPFDGPIREPIWPFWVRMDGGGQIMLSQSGDDASRAHYYDFSISSHGTYVTEYNGECSIDRNWTVQ